MSKDFGTMKSEIGNNVQDTSASFATLVGVWLNNRYRDILRRTNWNVVNNSYTFNTVAGTNDYTLPSDFGKEVYVYNETSGIPIESTSLQGLLVVNQGNLTDQGDPNQYVILDGYATGARTKQVRLYPTPSSVITIQMPYTVQPTALSASTDITVFACEDAIILGAMADAWRYKRQFAKAVDFETLYEKSIVNHIWDAVNQPNQVTMFNVKSYSRETV